MSDDAEGAEAGYDALTELYAGDDFSAEEVAEMAAEHIATEIAELEAEAKKIPKLKRGKDEGVSDFIRRKKLAQKQAERRMAMLKAIAGEPERRKAEAEKAALAEAVPVADATDAVADEEMAKPTPIQPQTETSRKIAEAIAESQKDGATEPTEAQKEAGNYKKAHVKIGNLDISIENPIGSTRSGHDTNGKEWSTTMQNSYGYIRGTESVDGDHIDVFLNDDAFNDEAPVFVIDQTKEDGSFDEHKVMLGFNNAEEAMQAYLNNYDSNWMQSHPGIRITEASRDNFDKWVESSHRKTKPFADYAMNDREGTASAHSRLPQ